MALNLTKLLTSMPSNRYLVLAANEESLPLVNFVAEHLMTRLGTNLLRRSFSADRFFNCNQISELLMANSLFGESYFIQLEFKTKPSSAHQQQLSQVISQLGAQDFLLISCAKLDKKDLAASWFKDAQQTDALLVLQGNNSEALTWAQYCLQQGNITLREQALSMLLEMNQNNFAQLQQDLQRLILAYPSGGQLDYNELQANLVDNAQYNVFALSHAYLTGNISLCHKILSNLLQTSDEMMLILWNLAEDLRKLLQIKANLRTNPNFEQAINGLRLWGEQVGAFQRAQQRLSYQQLVMAFASLAELDCVVKGIKPGNPQLKLEQLIMFLCLGR